MVAAAAVTSQSGSDPLRLALLWSGADAAGHPIRDGVVLTEGRGIVAVGTRAAVRVPPADRILNCAG
jgi:hypothetical protein